MRSRALPLAATCLALTTVFTAPTAPAYAAWPADPSGAMLVSSPSAISYGTTSVSDGSGGAIIGWVDYAIFPYVIRAQRITGAGEAAGGWPGGGMTVAIPGGSANVDGLVMTADGTGGAFLAWHDSRFSSYDVFVQHITGSGAITGGWPANGLDVGYPAVNEFLPQITLDGSGGVVLVWRYDFSGSDRDLYGARVSAGGTKLWGTGIQSSSADQQNGRLCGDGSSGAFIVFTEGPNGSQRGRILHINPSGTVDRGPFNLTGMSGPETSPAAIADGQGGVIAVWNEFAFVAGGEIYCERWDSSLNTSWSSGTSRAVAAGPGIRNLQSQCGDGKGGAYFLWLTQSSGLCAMHLFASGADAIGWPSGGIVITSYLPNSVSAQPDSVGGVLFAWTDYGSSFTKTSLYAERFTSAGYPAPGYPYNGKLLRVSVYNERFVSLVPDGAGGSIVSWTDEGVTLAYKGAYASRIDRFGAIGDATPHLAGVRDVPGDQGGKVRVAWNASNLDADPSYGISEYRLWRQAPAALVTARLAHGAKLADAQSGALEPGALAEASGIFWEYVASQPASQYPTYSLVAATTSDSLPTGNPRTVFKVQAMSTAPIANWDSAPDSGYSVDNLPPNQPAPFTGAYIAGGTHLHWGENSEPDFASYRLYRGSSSSFVPGSSNLVVEKPDTGYVDTGSAGSWYKLVAFDSHMNASTPAILSPSSTTQVGDPSPVALAFAGARPNPMTAGGAVGFSLSRKGATDLAIFDAAGRRVRTLAAGELDAGEHWMPWDGRDNAGRALGNGLYFARLSAEGRTLVTHFALIR